MIDRRRFLPDTGMKGHPISRQFLHPNRIQHMLIALAQFDDYVGTYFFLSRKADQLAFDDREREMAQNIADHVGRAIRLYRSLRLAEVQVIAFARALEHLSEGVILVDSDLRILHANSAAELLLAERIGLSRCGRRFALHDPHAQGALEACIRQLTRFPPPSVEKGIRATRPGGGTPVRITAQPALGDAIATISARGQVLLFIDDPDQVADASSDALAKSFNLTPAEARVAALAARPMRVAEIATQLGVSENTTKTQLKSVYQKAGATSRAEFVRLLPPTGRPGAI